MTGDRVHRVQTKSESLARADTPTRVQTPRLPSAITPDTVLGLQRFLGNGAVTSMLDLVSDARNTYPWIGIVRGATSAALRRDPSKHAGSPHANTLADLPRGTQVTVFNKKGGWLAVEAEVAGVAVRGYVSQELVGFVNASAVELPEVEVKTEMPTVPRAVFELKRAETQKAGGRFELTPEERDKLDLCISVLRATGKYKVDGTTYRVSFDRPLGGKTQVTTIEDFILFVEEVERTYPSAQPQEVAAEVRQLWFSDANWELLVASQGIRDSDSLVDIETAAPVATSFDMKQMAPIEGSLQVDTPLGRVDIGHVMSGIDASLSGMPPAYPEEFLEERESATGGDHDTYKNEAKYEALKTASHGDVRDFTTWAGDLGQAYAEYLVDRYLRSNTGATLAHWVAQKAPREELLGDVHGYIALELHSSTPASASESPTGDRRQISDILRNMYLVSRSTTAASEAFGKVSGKSPDELRTFITERVIAFARTWYAKRAYEEKGADAWSASGVLKEKGADFDAKHAANSADAEEEDKVESLVGSLLNELSGAVK
jgi:hypothetical protein